MKDMKINGFTLMTDEEKQLISAGAGIASTIGTITSTITGGLSSIINTADDLSDTIIKNKIVNKIDEVEKGEIELKKDGGIRLKWDSTVDTNGTNIIF